MVGKSLSHYKITAELGRGGMGVVYKAVDTKLDRTVAIKVLPPDMTRDPIAKKRFIHEAKAASALDHPNICTIHAIEETDEEQMFIVMAYYEGSSLAEYVDGADLDLEQILNFSIQACRGLHRAHRSDIIHRDIKPANLMVTTEGEIKIVDFGLAKVSNQTQITQEGSTIGTTAYMSPEQARGESVDTRTDQWSMGAVLYEMLAGQRAFRGEYSQAIIYSLLNEDPESLTSLNPTLPTRLVAIVDRMLQKDPDDRFPSLAEALDELQNVLARERGLEPSFGDARQILRLVRSPKVLAIGAIVLAGIVFLSVRSVLNQREKAYARDVLIPRIEGMMDAEWSDYWEVYQVLEEALTIFPDNAYLQEVLNTATRESTIRSTPDGADVSIKPYSEPDAESWYLGTTPIENVRLPISIFRWKFEKDGFNTVEAAAPSWGVGAPDGTLAGTEIHRRLDSTGMIPDGMVRVAGFERPDGVRISDFFIHRLEVTNAEFLAFIQNGGYRTPEHWKYPFAVDGDTISWEEAMARFGDQTGRPGPSTWQGGVFPDGEENYPVSGVSWHEAAAYGEWVGKSLPTAAHWGRARGEYTDLIQWPQMGGFATFAPFSNFGAQGPVSAGSLPGYTVFGAYDMAGNVREWMLNPTPVGRMIRGGAWGDNTYAFTEPAQAPEFDRSPKNGFRLALYEENEAIAQESLENSHINTAPDFASIEPVDDETFARYLRQFDYAPYDLEIAQESVTAGDGWRLERYSYANPYNEQRIVGNLFLPTDFDPPYQVVVYVPGSASLFQTSSVDIGEYYEYPLFLEWIVKNGRAVLYPTFEGTFERSDMSILPLYSGNNKTYAFSTHAQHLVMDFRASLDYLETRDDIEMDRVAYYGMSWGAAIGGIIPAVEDRIKTIVLIPPILLDNGLPEVSPINYVGRITQPLLALAGTYDTLQNPEVHIMPAFELFGTPDDQKHLIFFETDHIPPKTDMIREVLTWLDEYLGPVN